MRKIKETLDTIEEFTMDEFWTVIDAIPDTDDGKKHKDNINKYFKKDGTPKAKALSPKTQDDYQSIYDTEVFLSTYVGKEIHLNKLHKRVAAHKQIIKEKKVKTHKVTKYGKIERRYSGRVQNEEDK